MHAKTKFLIAAASAGLLFTTLVARGQQTSPPVSTTHTVTANATHKVLSNATHKVSPTTSTTTTTTTTTHTPVPSASTGGR